MRTYPVCGSATLMTPQVVTAGCDASVLQVAELMRAREVGSVVLEQDGRPVGFVTDRDLVVGVLAIGGDPAACPSRRTAASRGS